MLTRAALLRRILWPGRASLFAVVGAAAGLLTDFVAFLANYVTPTLLTAGCSGLVSGSYQPANGGAHFESLVFKSGGKVEITFQDAVIEGDDEIDDGKAKITGPEGSRLFTIVGGSGLIGLGRYCRS
jgi:predicted anti-sigma-YlaC factor YlaD